MFMLHGVLMIPKVVVQPNLDDVQDALIIAGKFISCVSKGVGQWSGGKTTKVISSSMSRLCIYAILILIVLQLREWYVIDLFSKA